MSDRTFNESLELDRVAVVSRSEKSSRMIIEAQPDLLSCKLWQEESEVVVR